MRHEMEDCVGPHECPPQFFSLISANSYDVRARNIKICLPRHSTHAHVLGCQRFYDVTAEKAAGPCNDYFLHTLARCRSSRNVFATSMLSISIPIDENSNGFVAAITR